VPYDHEGQWVQSQRNKQASLSAERKARLDELGFVWDVLAEQWEEGFQHLREYANKHGHCRVPADYRTRSGYKLGVWVKIQRRRKGVISAERKARLDALGFVWDAIADQWEEGFQHLREYAEKHGDCRVPFAYVALDGYRLGQWVQVQ